MVELNLSDDATDFAIYKKEIKNEANSKDQISEPKPIKEKKTKRKSTPKQATLDNWRVDQTPEALTQAEINFIMSEI